MDGELDEEDGLEAGPDAAEHVVKIGYTSSDFPGPSGFTGSIDDVCIYCRALSPGEIEAVRTSSKQIAGDLVGRWNFEKDATDVSGNGNHGRVVGATAAPGKTGRALKFSGDSYVLLPSSQGDADRNQIWTLVTRDFTDEQSHREMQWEQEDKIWANDWEDRKELATRYSAACRNIAGLRTKAAALGAADGPVDFEQLRAVYHLSRAAERTLAASRNKINLMVEEIGYLDDNYSQTHAKWKQYKADVTKHARAMERTVDGLGIGGETMLDELSGLEMDAGQLHSRIPLRLPSGPEGPGRFGAYYARLKFSLSWDKFWRVGQHPDVVVRFDEFDHRFVFWRGTSFIPCWATYDGAWYTNEFFERRGWLSGGSSMCEPMSDKQCRYSHVRIVESNDARVVVHWRYSPVDLDYQQPYRDPETKWGDWVDEVYTIYPDSVGVRKASIHSSSPKKDWIEYQESIVVNQPGTIPEENIHFDALTFANLKGESKTYTWTEDGGPNFDEAPGQPCIQVVNFKNKTRPFSVVNPDGVKIRPYGGHGRNSHFNWWNHWPVAQERSDTTEATSADKPSHSSLSHITWKEMAREEITRTWIMLNGMTDKPAAKLAPLARSWLSPPALNVAGEQFVSQGYDSTERAYTIDCKTPGEDLKCELAADEYSPVVNLALVINSWGERSATLKINGREIQAGRDFRLGHRRTLNAADLIVWVRITSTVPVRISLSPTG